MSGCGEERTSDGGGGRRSEGGSGGDEEEEEEGGGGGASQQGDDGEEEQEGSKSQGEKGKGKKLSFFRLKKAKKHLPSRKLRSNSVKLGCFGRRAGGVGGGGAGGGVGSCLCWKQPRSLDSSIESPTSDPNSAEFTYEMLKTFIEKNDFLSEECNPHLDVEISFSDDQHGT